MPFLYSAINLSKKFTGAFITGEQQAIKFLIVYGMTQLA